MRFGWERLGNTEAQVGDSELYRLRGWKSLRDIETDGDSDRET